MKYRLSLITKENLALKKWGPSNILTPWVMWPLRLFGLFWPLLLPLILKATLNIQPYSFYYKTQNIQDTCTPGRDRILMRILKCILTNILSSRVTRIQADSLNRKTVKHTRNINGRESTSQNLCKNLYDYRNLTKFYPLQIFITLESLQHFRTTGSTSIIIVHVVCKMCNFFFF